MTITHHVLAIAMVMAVALPTVGSGREAPRLRMHVTPAFGVAPALLRIDAFVQPAADNRAVEFVADSDGYYRSSTIELSGASAAAVQHVEFPAVPEGDYEVRVALVGRDGETRVVLTDRVLIVP